MNDQRILNILEAALLVSDAPLSVDKLLALFADDSLLVLQRQHILEYMLTLQHRYQDRGIELVEVASGFRLQAKAELSPWLSKLWEERAPRYSRALLETLAIIAYQQPITRAEIEDIRGVAVSSHIIKTLQDREWIKVIGHKDVPGKPAILATSKQFLDYFNLKSLGELPTLREFNSLEAQENQLQGELPLHLTKNTVMTLHPDADVENEDEAMLA